MKVQRYSRRPYRVLLWVLAVAAVLARFYWMQQQPSADPEPLGEGVYTVDEVIDGDTLRIGGAPIRLIGVDCPELRGANSEPERWSREATRFTEAFVASGEARLRFDRERIDQYDRYLAYVYVGDELLNEQLVRAGLARARLHYHYSDTMKRLLRKAEEDAKARAVGLWSQQP